MTSFFKLSRVELAAEVRSTIIGNFVVPAFWIGKSHKPDVEELLQASLCSFLVEIRASTRQVEMDDRWWFSDVDLVEVLKENIVFFVHPVSPPPTNHLTRAAHGLSMSLLHDGLGTTISDYLCSYTGTTLIRSPTIQPVNDSLSGLSSGKQISGRRQHVDPIVVVPDDP